MDREATRSTVALTRLHGTLLIASPTRWARNHEPVRTRYSPRSMDEARVLDALATVVDPCSIATGVPLSISDMGLVREIVVDSGTALVKLRLTNPLCFQIGIISEAIEKKIHALDLGCVIEVDPVDPWSTDLMTQDARDRLRRKREA
jgi:metal-sulfur cluster biosynthetic enzyme